MSCVAMLRTLRWGSGHPRRLPHRQLESLHLPRSSYLIHRQRRAFVNMPGILVPPVVFGGLLVSLWIWKCFMMVVFQNKIIYMPGLPPNARSERIEDYKNQCAGIKWHEEKIRAEDGTKLSLCVSSVEQQVDSPHFSKSVYILYFQGNASSLPPRLPFLSPVLKVLKEHHHDSVRPTQFIMVCCSYRGYWRSKGRPSEQGIAKDAVATLEWIKSHCQPQSNVPVIIWGQSIGAGVATALAARQELFSDEVALQSLILETPFISIRSMLETLYPQKWLPYRYLWPFLRNHLDSWKALGNLDETAARLRTRTPAILFLEAGRDELVPKEHGNLLARRCSDLELEHRRVTIGRALHTDILAYPDGQNAVVDAIRQAADRSP